MGYLTAWGYRIKFYPDAGVNVQQAVWTLLLEGNGLSRDRLRWSCLSW
jgi:hypothetical protein